MCEIDPPIACPPTVDAIATVAQAFRDGIDFAVVCHGRDHCLEEGERAACRRCNRQLGDGDRGFVLGHRVVCPTCAEGLTVRMTPAAKVKA